jgi:hypothetical protein
MLPAHRRRQLQLPCRSVLPHKDNVNFVGRENVLSRIYNVLRPEKPSGTPDTQSVFVLSGLGGVGKTQIAIRFAVDHMLSFQVVLFAHAQDPRSLLDDFARFSVDLGLVDRDEPDQYHCCKELKKWFEETGKCESSQGPRLVLTTLKTLHGS